MKVKTMIFIDEKKKFEAETLKKLTGKSISKETLKFMHQAKTGALFKAAIKAGAMLVQQGVVNGRIGQVKTEASNDEIPLDLAFAQILLSFKGDRTNGLVFPSPVTGGCFYAGMIQQQILKPAAQKIGLPGVGWHVFRHTYRSFLDETGAPIGVQQKLMRHSNVATTMNVYGNSTLKAKQQANSKVVQMVMPQEKPRIEAESVAV